LGPKALQTVDVAGHSMVVEVALYHGPQPLPDFGHWLVPAPPKLFPYCFAFCSESLTDSLAIDREATGFLVFRTDVREPQKIKRLRLALASPLSVLGCAAPELNQARFIRVQFQPELSQIFLRPDNIKEFLNTFLVYPGSLTGRAVLWFSAFSTCR
jgi:hypothetical protein